MSSMFSLFPILHFWTTCHSFSWYTFFPSKYIIPSISYTNTIDDISFSTMNNFSAINIFNTNIRHLSGPRLIEKGRSLVTLINGNAFYPLSSWLNDIRLKFWKKPISDQDTSQLMLFCLGDGYSLHFITKWILTSQNWATAKKGEKLARQVFY